MTACEEGNIQTTLTGQFIRIVDNCGADQREQPRRRPRPRRLRRATDCTIPAGHSVGDTHSARTGFYELNRIKEQARGYLPANAWLQAQLTSTMNINSTCNAFWNGVIGELLPLRRACRNTGEIAGDLRPRVGPRHGRQRDQRRTSPARARPSPTSTAILRLNNSCMGRGFFKRRQLRRLRRPLHELHAACGTWTSPSTPAGSPTTSPGSSAELPRAAASSDRAAARPTARAWSPGRPAGTSMSATSGPRPSTSTRTPPWS